MKQKFLLYQMDVSFGNPDENMEKIEEVLDQTQPLPNTMLILPELFLTGYSKKGIDMVASQLGEGRYFERLKEICSEYAISIYGSIPTMEKGKIFNTALLMTDRGIERHYHKSHLFAPMGEDKLFSRGQEINNAIFNNINYGLSICYDLRFPELYQEQIKLGADVLLVVAEWPITRIEHWRALARARAIENQVYCIAVNRVGVDPDYQYGGHSIVYSPFGETVVELNHDKEAIIECVIDTQEVIEFRNKFNVKEDKWILQ